MPVYPGALTSPLPLIDQVVTSRLGFPNRHIHRSLKLREWQNCGESSEGLATLEPSFSSRSRATYHPVQLSLPQPQTQRLGWGGAAISATDRVGKYRKNSMLCGFEKSEPAFRSCTRTAWSRLGFSLERNKSRMLMKLRLPTRTVLVRQSRD